MFRTASCAPSINRRSIIAAARPPISRSPASAGMRTVFQTKGAVLIFPGSGTGAWEAALVNTLSPGDRVLAYETGHFSTLWTKVARNLGLAVDYLPGDWRHGADPAAIGAKLAEDHDREIKAVMVVHNETSTGSTSDVAAVRRAMDEARHPALLLVDTVSSLGSMDYRHDEWRVDVAVAASQKGLMLPPGLAFNAVSAKAIEASKTARLPKNYWRWDDMLSSNTTGFFPSTPATNLLFGLREALRMLEEEGLENVYRRHLRLAEATRRAVGAWGLELLALESGGAQPHGDGGPAAGPLRRGGAPRADPRPFQYVPRSRSRQGRGPRLPYRPPRQF